MPRPLIALAVLCLLPSPALAEPCTITRKQFEEVPMRSSPFYVQNKTGCRGELVQQSLERRIDWGSYRIKVYRYAGSRPGSTALFLYRNENLEEKQQDGLE